MPNNIRGQDQLKTKSFKSNRLLICLILMVEGQLILNAAMTSLGFEAKNQTIYQMIAQLDADGSGQIDFEQFLHLMTARISQKDSRQDIKKVFNLFDDEKTGKNDQSGYISIKNLRRVAKQLGETMDDNQLQQMIDRADTDNDGLVSQQEFYNIMTKKTFA